LFAAAGDVAGNLFELLLGDQRAHLGGGVEAGADLHLLSDGAHAFEDLVEDALVGEEAGAGAAGLALIEEDGGGGASDGGVHVGIGEDDGGRFTAEFEGDLFEVAGGGDGDEFADLGRSGEGDLVDERVGGEWGAAGLAEAGEDIDDAGGEAGLDDELGETEATEGGLLGELENDGAAGGEGGTELPGGHEQGEVPGDDLGDDTDGLAGAVGEEVVTGGEGNGGPEGLGGPAGHVAEEVGGEGNICNAGDGDGLAVIKRFEFGELFGVLLDELPSFQRSCPRLEGLMAGHGPESKARRAAWTARSTST